MTERWILRTMSDLLHRSATPLILLVLPTMIHLDRGHQVPLHRMLDSNVLVYSNLDTLLTLPSLELQRSKHNPLPLHHQCQMVSQNIDSHILLIAMEIPSGHYLERTAVKPHKVSLVDLMKSTG